MSSPFDIVKTGLGLARKKAAQKAEEVVEKSIDFKIVDRDVVIKNGRGATWDQIRDEVTRISKLPEFSSAGIDEILAHLTKWCANKMPSGTQSKKEKQDVTKSLDHHSSGCKALKKRRGNGIGSSSELAINDEKLQRMITDTLTYAAAEGARHALQAQQQRQPLALENGGIGDRLLRGMESVVSDAAQHIADNGDHEHHEAAMDLAAETLKTESYDTVLEEAVKKMIEDEEERVLEKAAEAYTEENEEEVIQKAVEEAKADGDFLDNLVDSSEVIKAVLNHDNFEENIDESDEDKLIELAKEIRKKRRRSTR